MQKQWHWRIVGGSLDDVTAYVTLEPCSFVGRTPSCAHTLVERGIKKVVVATLGSLIRVIVEKVLAVLGASRC